MARLLHSLRLAFLLLAALLPHAASAQAAPGAWSGLWWNPQESGWGIHLTQRRDAVFAAWFTYASSGRPRWLTASDCRMAGTTCNGTVYETRGPRFFGTAFNPAAVVRTAVGQISIAFTGAHSATMTYTVDGQSRSVLIQRQFDEGDPIPPQATWTDLYWNPDESGWGLAVSEQRLSLFLVWYVYDDAANPVWYFASRCEKYASGEACQGPLYRATGPGLGPGFDPSRVTRVEVGRVSLASLSNGYQLNWTIDGVNGEKRVFRQQF